MLTGTYNFLRVAHEAKVGKYVVGLRNKTFKGYEVNRAPE